MKKKIFQGCVIAVALVVGASAQVASAQTKITIAHPGAISASGSILLATAQEQGLFAKYGLEAQLIGGSTGAIRSVGKEAEFRSFGTGATLLDIAQQGTDLKMLGAFTTGRSSDHLVTRAEIKKPEDLRGKRFGVGTMGSGVWVNTVLALEHLGLDPKRDNITILSVGNLTQMAKALEDGTIDAAMLAPAQSSQMKSKGFSVLLDMYPNNIYGPQTVPITTGAYLREHPDVVEKVVTALVEATAFSLAPRNKPTVLKTIMKVFGRTDLEAAETGYEALRGLNLRPYPTIERLKSMQKVMALHEPKVLSVKVGEVIEDRFVRKLDENGTIDRFYNTYGVK